MVLLPLCGTPVIARTGAAFAERPQADEVLVGIASSVVHSNGFCLVR